MLAEYIRSHPDNEFTQDARAKLKETSERIARYDHDKVIRDADGAGKQYERAASILQAYLDTAPPPPYRSDAEKRLALLPSLIDDRDYASIDQRFPESTADLEGRRAALQEYLAKQPQGRHVDGARNALARIDDAIDERDSLKIKNQVESLRSAQRWNEAIAAADRGLEQVKSEKRRAALVEIRRSVRAAVEEEELTSIRKLVKESSADSQKIVSECRLFLLTHPQGSHTQEIRGLLDKTLADIRAPEWAKLKEELGAQKGDPRACLQSIDEHLRRWPEEASQKALREARAPYCVELFKVAVAKLQFVRDGTIVCKDGKTFTGDFIEHRTAYELRDPAKGKARRVSKSEIQTYTPGPKARVVDEITKRASQLDPAKPSLTELRDVVAVAEQNGMVELANLVRVLLVEIDPNDANAMQGLDAAGWVRAAGRWFPSGDEAIKARVNAVLERHKKAVLDGARDVAAGFGVVTLKFTYPDEGRKEAEVKCSALFTEFVIDTVSKAKEPLKARVLARFKVGLDPVQSRDVKLGPKVRKDIKDLAAKVVFEAEIEIEGHDAPRGVGMKVKRDDAGVWSVATVDAGGSADKAWIEVGDELLTVDGKRVADPTTERQVDAQLDPPAGSSISLQLRRRGQEFAVKLSPDDVSRFVLKARFRIAHNLQKEGPSPLWVDLPPIDELP